MKEIEVKVIDIDKKDIEKRLKKIKAKKTFEGTVSSILFDTKDKKLRKSKQLLRIRKKGKEIFVTFKEKLSKKKVKVMKEWEVNIDDFKTMASIVEALGFSKKLSWSKKRISYKLGKVHFELDKNPRLPWLLEIEAPSIKLIHRACKKLNIDKKELKPWSTRDLYKHYKR